MIQGARRAGLQHAIPDQVRNAKTRGAPIIYLSGSIRKGRSDTRAEDTFWTDADVAKVAASILHPDALIINPATAGIRRSDPYANFGCDLFLVQSSSIMIVDARTEKGIGVGGEMMYAHSLGIPIVTVAPPNSNYRRDVVEDICGEDLVNWVHPFVFGLSSVIVDSFEAAGAAVEEFLLGTAELPSRPLGDSIEHFERSATSWSD